MANTNNKIFLAFLIISTVIAVTNIFLGMPVSNAMVLYAILLISGLTFLVLGKNTVLGVLYLVFTIKTFWLAAIAKIYAVEAFDTGLKAPEITLTVYFYGMVGIFLAALTIYFYRPNRGLIPLDSEGRQIIRTYALALIVFGLIAGFALKTVDEGVPVGGLWGVAKTFARLGIVGLALFAVVLDKDKYKVKIDVSLFCIFVAIFFFKGLIAAGKEQMMMPLVIAFIVAVRVYGITSPRIWGAAVVGIMFYVTIVYPYSQYTRFTVRDATFSESIEIAMELSLGFITGGDIVAEAESHISKNSIAEENFAPDGMKSLKRLMFMGEADILINETYHRQEFTGFKTITHGFEMMVPYFIYPEKPQHNVGAFLGYYAGLLAEDDFTTQVSFGFIANLYNAFGMSYVLLSTYILCLFFFSMLIIFWGRTPGLTFSSVIIFFGLHHSFVEGTVATQVMILRQPINYVIVYLMVLFLVKYLKVRI